MLGGKGEGNSVECWEEEREIVKNVGRRRGKWWDRRKNCWGEGNSEEEWEKYKK